MGVLVFVYDLEDDGENVSVEIHTSRTGKNCFVWSRDSVMTNILRLSKTNNRRADVCGFTGHSRQGLGLTRCEDDMLLASSVLRACSLHSNAPAAEV